MEERLQKVLARAGFGSRRACEELIAAGRVAVDGSVARLGNRVDPEQARITVDDVPVVTRVDLAYYLLNKPVGVVTTASDPFGRPVVTDLVPASPRVFPVGRLDADTEGLLLLMNDGELANLLTHPRYGIDKEYLAEVDGVPTRTALRRLREGIELEDGPASADRVDVVQRQHDGAALRIVVHEGRNRMVRRMCEAVGHPVRRLVRTRIASLRDPRLAPGKWRQLTTREIRSLYESSHRNEQAPQ